MAITLNTKPSPYHLIKSLQLLWRLGNILVHAYRWSCSDLIRMLWYQDVVQAMASGWYTPLWDCSQPIISLKTCHYGWELGPIFTKIFHLYIQIGHKICFVYLYSWQLNCFKILHTHMLQFDFSPGFSSITCLKGMDVSWKITHLSGLVTNVGLCHVSDTDVKIHNSQKGFIFIPLYNCWIEWHLSSKMYRNTAYHQENI